VKYAQARKSVDLFRIDRQDDYSHDGVRGMWCYGAPGTGKSHYAREISGDSLYLKPQNKWFDGYTGQENILIDDFD